MVGLQPERSTRIQVESDTAFLRVTDALDREAITLPEEIRERVAQLEKLATVGLFTSSIAHEIKNALVGVKTCVQLAAGTELGPLANREVMRIESLVNLLSQYVSKNKESFTEVKLNEVVRNATRSLEAACATKNLSLQVQLEAAQDAIDGSSIQLEQALLKRRRLEGRSGSGLITIPTRCASNCEIPDPGYRRKTWNASLNRFILRRRAAAD